MPDQCWGLLGIAEANWNSSGSFNLPTLSPSVLSGAWDSLVLPFQTPLPHPVSRIGSPAYFCTSLMPMKTLKTMKVLYIDIVTVFFTFVLLYIISCEINVRSTEAGP